MATRRQDRNARSQRRAFSASRPFECTYIMIHARLFGLRITGPCSQLGTPAVCALAFQGVQVWTSTRSTKLGHFWWHQRHTGSTADSCHGREQRSSPMISGRAFTVLA
eukprot:scaffold119328_cov17-Tisochrysis_lutea.AAC.1